MFLHSRCVSIKKGDDVQAPTDTGVVDSALDRSVQDGLGFVQTVEIAVRSSGPEQGQRVIRIEPQSLLTLDKGLLELSRALKQER
jgi:hypothetical protein